MCILMCFKHSFFFSIKESLKLILRFSVLGEGEEAS